MDIEFDKKGKFFTNVVTKISVPATIQTTSQRLPESHVYRIPLLESSSAF